MKQPGTKDASSAGATAKEGKVGVRAPHWVESEVQRRLLANPKLKFESLVVRRFRDGICLQGVLEVDDETPDVCELACKVSGVKFVLNHLVEAPRRLPPKG